jgi:hypothetical protein
VVVSVADKIIELIDCPMVRKRVSLLTCSRCEYHHAIVLRMQVETKDPTTGGMATSEIKLIREVDEQSLRRLKPDAQITVMGRYLSCGFPRQLPIETVVVDG